MPYNLPHRIQSEADLKYFEDYLNLERMGDSKTNTLLGLLKNQVGKLIRIDCINCRYIGILAEIGADYLMLYTNQNSSGIVIPLYSVKALSFSRN